MGWDLPIPISSHLYKWNEKISHSCLYIFFGTKIYPHSVPKDMGLYEISSQLEKFTFLVGNQTGWDEIYQSHFRPVYASEIKKSLISVPKFFYGTKIYPNSVLNGMRSRKISHLIRKNCHP